MSKTVYEIAAENGFRVFAAYTKPGKHGNEYAYLRLYSNTWPYLVMTYKGAITLVSERMGTRKRSLYDSEPEIFSETINKGIPAARIPQAAKAFTDAVTIMSELKEINPQLPPWREYEEPEWGDR